MTTSRTDFNETWLTEAPTGLGDFETYDGLEYHIRDLLSNNINPEQVNDQVKKIDLSQTQYYWIEDKSGTIILGLALDKMPQGLVIRLTGKHPKYRGRPPYASDLYMTVLRDNKNKSLRLVSDEALSDEGKNLWDRMFKTGFNVSVYDKTQPGKTFTTFKTQEEMDRYFKHDDTDYKKYQYVLSEVGEMLAETRSYFNTRRYRELIPGLLGE
jgi:hypothetical protein